jgi:hypothetical protein
VGIVSLPPLAVRSGAWPEPRACSWPDGGCGELIYELRSHGKGRKQVIDFAPGTGLVVGSRITTLAQDDGIVVGWQHPDVELVVGVVPVWKDHHETCEKWRAKQDRERKARIEAGLGKDRRQRGADR